jgi:SAM-dependent methyltransferase
MKNLLKHPAVYQAYQEMGGFFDARLRAIRDYLPIPVGARIVDIGCGPGYIVRHLPRGIRYTGFDIDAPSVAHARERFGDLGEFHCEFFDPATAAGLGPVDIIMMNGVMHHIGDDELGQLLGWVADALTPEGILFTLDGCYVTGQSRVARWLLDNDRGRHVRDTAGYRQLLEAQFPHVEMHLREDYSRLPYSFAIGIGRKSGSGSARNTAEHDRP